MIKQVAVDGESFEMKRTSPRLFLIAPCCGSVTEYDVALSDGSAMSDLISWLPGERYYASQ